MSGEDGQIGETGSGGLEMPGKKQKGRSTRSKKAAGRSSQKAAQGKVVSLSEKRGRKKVVPLRRKKEREAVAAKGVRRRRPRFRIPEGLQDSIRRLAIRLRLSSGTGAAASKKAAGRPGGPARSGRGEWFSRAAASLQGVLPAESGGTLRRLCTVEGLVAVMLAVLLFYPPYFRGLFFSRELLPTHMYTAVIFALFAFYKLSRRELSFFRAPLDYAVFILLGLYLTSSAVAWNARDAAAAVLKMANYTAVYWLLASVVRSLKAVRGYLAVYFLSGAGVALLGLGAAFGTFRYKDAFVGGRIYSSLQYPNSLASFLTAVNLFGLYFQAVAVKLPYRLLLAAGNYLLFLTFLGTQSRGAYLIYPLGLIVLLAGLPGGARLRSLGCFLLQALCAVLVSGRVMACTGGGAALKGWLWVLVGAALAAGLQYLWHRLEQPRPAPAPGARRRRLRPWVLPAAGVLAVLIAAGGGYYALRDASTPAAAAARILPQSWVERVQSISLQEKNAQERLLWSRDALKIMTAGPVNALLGTGGGGWNALYHKYQDYYYSSTEVHNHFLQVGVETGFPGLLAFLAVWFCFLLSTVAVLRGRVGEDVKGTSWAIFAAALSLGIHSFLDFNLSLGAVALFLWGLFGLQRGLQRLFVPSEEAAPAGGKKLKERRTFTSSPFFQGAAVGLAAFLVFFVSLNLFLGEKYAAAATTAAKEQNAQQVVNGLERAAQCDPWKASYRMELGRIYMQAGTEQGDGRLLGLALERLREAVRLNRGDAGARVLYAGALFRAGQVEEGVRQLEEALSLAPLRQSLYEDLAQGYLSAGRYLLERPLKDSRQGGEGTSQEVGEPQGAARDYLVKAAQVPQRLKRRMAAVPEAYRRYWVKAPQLAVTPSLQLSAGEAAALLGRREEAVEYLAGAERDDRFKAEALLWRGLVLERMGRSAEGKELVGRALELKPELAEERDRIQRILPR